METVETEVVRVGRCDNTGVSPGFAIGVAGGSEVRLDENPWIPYLSFTVEVGGATTNTPWYGP